MDDAGGLQTFLTAAVDLLGLTAGINLTHESVDAVAEGIVEALEAVEDRVGIDLLDVGFGGIQGRLTPHIPATSQRSMG